MPLAFFLSESRLSDDIYVLPSSYKVSKHYLSKPPCVLSINFVCQNDMSQRKVISFS